jgi:hypothetical protein
MAGFRCPNNSCQGKVHFYALDGKTNEHGFNCAGQPKYAIEDATGQLWYADDYPGIRNAPSLTATCELLSFNAPYSDKVGELAIQNGVLYVATGGVTDAYGFLNRLDGFMERRDGLWTTYNHLTQPALNRGDLKDYLRIVAHPDLSRVYVGSFLGGLIEYDFNAFEIYNQTNSILQGAVGDAGSTRVSGLVFDQQNNLWISNFLSPKPIVVKKADGTWTSFSVPKNTELAQVVIDHRGYKWFAVISTAEGVLVFDDGGTPDNPADDRYKYFNASNSAFPTNLLATLAVDREGDIWVGTREGPVVFDGAQDPFSGD